jgi:ABC-type Fe3+/spermidine/putrescine transport system ATPase subunit
VSGSADVELVSVSRTFGSLAAVDDISITIRPGEFFSLLGPSGCGKTTTLRMIGGFELPSRGEIWIKGERMGSVPPNRRPTNMVFQQLALFPHLTVFENIAFGLRLAKISAGEIRRRAGDAIALVSLGGLEARLASQLSGGQQQRVALARALVNEPSVLLLDEPFAALDLKLRSQMQVELKAIQRRLGTTFVFVTHDQGEAFGMSDRVALMNRGRIEQLGRPRDLYDSPQTRFVATFVGETNMFDATVTSRQGQEAVAEADGLIFRIRAGDMHPGDRIAISLRPERIEVVSSPVPGGVPATVRAAVLHGPTIRLSLGVGTGREISVVALNQGEAPPLPGAQTAVTWSQDSIVVLRT